MTAYTNQLGKVWSYAYDEGMRKTFETNANSEVLRYTNNAAGDLLSLTDGKSQTTRWKYDAYGRVTNKLDQAGTLILTYQYDAESRLTNRWSKQMGNTGYKYDAVGNLTNIVYPSGTTSVKFRYDWLNRLTNMSDAIGTTAFTYRPGGQLATEDGPFASDTVTNIYVNRLRTGLGLQQPTAGWTNGFTYDAARRLTSVVSPAGTFNYTYDPVRNRQVRKIALPNTSYITNTYDTVARLTGTYLDNSGNGVLDSAVYGYNTGSQRTAWTNGAAYVTYGYDSIGQLKTSASSVSSESRGYAYDSAWNLNYRTNNGALEATLTVNNLNEATAVAEGGVNYADSYDNNGNQTWYYDNTGNNGYMFSYDAENRLTQVEAIYSGALGGLVTLQYDGLGRLRSRTTINLGTGTTNVTHYVYDGWRVIQERDGSNNPQVAYTRGTDLSGSMEGAGGIGGLLARTHGYSSGTGAWSTNNYYHADGNGNITYLVNSSQGLAASYKYDPYGSTLSQSGTLANANVYQYSSKEQVVIDPQGTFNFETLYYYGYRFYAPNLQRWLNRDPLGEKGGLNQFEFDLNDPTDHNDAFGLALAPGGGLTGVKHPPGAGKKGACDPCGCAQQGGQCMRIADAYFGGDMGRCIRNQTASWPGFLGGVGGGILGTVVTVGNPYGGIAGGAAGAVAAATIACNSFVCKTASSSLPW